MKQWLNKAGYLVSALAIALVSVSTARAEEPEDAGPYYEDDAWYDVSEWFDGNDYNPTDEVIGEWDDEKYDFGKNDDDQDNDWDTGTYGYNTDTNDDWFYDYYGRNYTYSNDPNDYTLYVWYDYNQDANYDAYRDTSSKDRNYYSFNQNAANKKGAKQSKEMRNAKPQRKQVSGTVLKMKDVSVAGNKHLVVSVNFEGKDMAIDFGPKNDLKQANINQGVKIMAEGAVVPVAGKNILIARRAQINGKNLQIDRSPMDVKGKVTAIHDVTVRGNEQHTMAIIETNKGKKIAVDLGETNNVRGRLKEGEQVSVSGQLVKVKDRRVLFANSLEHQGEEIPIARGNGKSHLKYQNRNPSTTG